MRRYGVGVEPERLWPQLAPTKRSVAIDLRDACAAAQSPPGSRERRPCAETQARTLAYGTHLYARVPTPATLVLVHSVGLVQTVRARPIPGFGSLV